MIDRHMLSINKGDQRDARIVYDPHKRRFVVCAVTIVDNYDRRSSTIRLAVSKTSTPTLLRDSWQFSDINGNVNKDSVSSFASELLGLEVDEEVVYITVLFRRRDNDDILLTQLWVVDKDNGTVTSKLQLFCEDEEASPFIYVPALVRNPTGVGPNIGTFTCGYDGVFFDINPFILVYQSLSSLRL